MHAYPRSTHHPRRARQERGVVSFGCTALGEPSVTKVAAAHVPSASRSNSGSVEANRRDARRDGQDCCIKGACRHHQGGPTEGLWQRTGGTAAEQARAGARVAGPGQRMDYGPVRLLQVQADTQQGVLCVLLPMRRFRASAYPRKTRTASVELPCLWAMHSRRQACEAHLSEDAYMHACMHVCMYACMQTYPVCRLTCGCHEAACAHAHKYPSLASVRKHCRRSVST
jgi:hypothetical protein